jgi:predicted nucleic acid-binding protein
MDTDVASLAFKHRELPPPIVAALLSRQPCITFITLAELTKWGVLREWGEKNRARMETWLHNVLVIHSDDDLARTWGTLSAYAVRRGRPRPQNDMWIAACCLSYGVPLATLNIKDFADFAEYEGLQLVS